MMRKTDNDRAIACRYHPTEIGEYHVYVLWSGQHVPGSPFHVNIVDTLAQLNQLGSDISPTYSMRTLSSLSGKGLLFSDDF